MCSCIEMMVERKGIWSTIFKVLHLVVVSKQSYNAVLVYVYLVREQKVALKKE